MEGSQFMADLKKEAFLAKYLDGLYPKLFKKSSFSLQRVRDLSQQHKGVDLILTNHYNSYYVDEKAQLDYLNRSLPTFAF